jgi:hypothetical protein
LAKTTKIDSVSFKGLSGRSYTFRIYVWDTKFKPLAGVYVVASRSIDPGAPASYDPVFVGMAGDLSQVLKNHPRTECFQMYYANVVGVLQIDDAQERAAVLADLTDGLAPPCNAPDAV